MAGGTTTEGRFGVGRLAATIVLAAIAFLALRPAVDSDYGWHVANGRHLADGVLLGGRDVYSWTATGAPWVAHEWLTEAAMAALHDGIGPAANSVAAAAIVTVAFGLVAFRLRRRGVRWSVALVAVGLGFAATLVSMGVRPQLLELLYLALALALVDRRRDGALVGGPFLGAVGLLALVWAQTHGSFALFPAVLAVTTVGLALERAGDRTAVRDIGAGALLAALAPLLNPWGTALYAFSVQSLGSEPTQRLVEEWRPPDLLSPSFLPFTLELVLVVAAGLLLLAGMRRAGIDGQVTPRAPVGVPELLVALAVAALGLRSGRHVMLLGVAAAPLLAWAIERGMAVAGAGLRRQLRAPGARPGGRRAGPPAAVTDRLHAVAAVVICAVLAVSGWSRIEPGAQERALAGRYPTGLLDELDAAQAAQPGARLFNEYTWGGFLLQHRPALPVFVDGRSEVYGDAQLERYARIVEAGPEVGSELAALGVDLALLRAEAPLAGRLISLGWQRLAADDVGVLLAAPPS